jgi:hypothetical protein
MLRQQRKQRVVNRLGCPPCPEPHCTHMLRLKSHTNNLGLSPCPYCRSGESKAYILTEKKQGMRKCMRCRKDYTPKQRQGYGKFYVCPEHYWQRFAVGEVIIRKERPRTQEEIKKDMLVKRPFQAWKKRQQNVRMPPRA